MVAVGVEQSGEVFKNLLYAYLSQRHRPLDLWLSLGVIWRHMLSEGRCIGHHMHSAGGCHLASYAAVG